MSIILNTLMLGIGRPAALPDFSVVPARGTTASGTIAYDQASYFSDSLVIQVFVSNSSATPTFTDTGWTAWGTAITQAGFHLRVWWRLHATGAAGVSYKGVDTNSCVMATIHSRGTAIVGAGEKGAITNSTTGSSCNSYTTSATATTERVLAIGASNTVVTGAGTLRPAVPSGFTTGSQVSSWVIAEAGKPCSLCLSYRDVTGSSSATGKVTQGTVGTVSIASDWMLLLRPIKPV